MEVHRSNKKVKPDSNCRPQEEMIARSGNINCQENIKDSIYLYFYLTSLKDVKFCVAIFISLFVGRFQFINRAKETDESKRCSRELN